MSTSRITRLNSRKEAKVSRTILKVKMLSPGPPNKYVI